MRPCSVYMPSSCVPALKISTHGVSTLCLRRTSAGCPNTVPERALTILWNSSLRPSLDICGATGWRETASSGWRRKHCARPCGKGAPAIVE